METAPFVKKVMGLLNLSEEGQVGLFADQVFRNYEKQIKLYNKSIDKVTSDLEEFVERENEILAELNIDLKTTAKTVDLDSIKTRADRESYFSSFNYAIANAMSAVKRQEDKIKKQSENAEKQIKDAKDEIAKIEMILSVLSAE